MSEIYDYYVYYKISPDAGPDYLPVAIAMQSDIFRLTGIRGRLNKKSTDNATWMEIYEGVHQRLLFDAVLADSVARFHIENYLVPGSARVGEIFHHPLA